MSEKYPGWLPASIIASGLVLVAIIMSVTWKQNSRANQTISVTGSAKKLITSDMGILRGSIGSEAVTAEAAYRLMESQKPRLMRYLLSQGFAADKVTFFTVNNMPVYGINDRGMQTGKVIGYRCSQRLEISSSDVQKIRRISLDISSLVESGVNFTVETPEYYYTNLSELKIEIQAEAAKDANQRAARIAEATGRGLGALRAARMGVLQITPRFSNLVADYGINDITSIDKEINAVVSASFEIN